MSQEFVDTLASAVANLALARADGSPVQLSADEAAALLTALNADSYLTKMTRPVVLTEDDEQKILDLMGSVADRTRDDPPDLAGELDRLRSGETPPAEGSDDG